MKDLLMLSKMDMVLKKKIKRSEAKTILSFLEKEDKIELISIFLGNLKLNIDCGGLLEQV
ncbi:MAG: hypothetical protein AAB786_02080 [Patescibacteria group bacterium]